MADTTVPWFVGERSTVLAKILLTSQPGVRVKHWQDHDDGATLLATIATDEQLSTKMFVVEVRGTISSDPPDELDSVTLLFDTPADAVYWPTCVVVVDVRSDSVSFAWHAEPTIEAGVATLRVHKSGSFVPLDLKGVERLVAQVSAWYAARSRQLQPA